MLYRQMRMDEKGAVAQIYTQSYGVRPEEASTWLDGVKAQETWVAEEEGALLATLQIESRAIWMGQERIGMGGIACVATPPEYRLGGAAAGLMVHSLAVMRQAGMGVSVLYPFSVPFYRKYGWEVGGERRRVSLRPEQLAPLRNDAGKVRLWQSSEGSGMVGEIYTRFAQTHPGALARGEREWKTLLPDGKSNRLLYILDNQGYLIVDHQAGASGRTLELREWVALDAQAHRGLLGFLSRYQSQVNEISWWVPVDSPLPLLLPTPPTSGLGNLGMYRIVDLALAFKGWPYGELVVQVEDVYAPWNHGVFHISGQGAEPSRSAPQITCSIQTLAQLYLGRISPGQAQKLGVLEGDVIQATEFFPPREAPFLNDFF